MSNRRMIFLLFHLVLITAAILRLWLFGEMHYQDLISGVSPADFPNYYFPGIRLAEGRPLYESLAGDVFRALGWQYGVYPADTPFTLVLFYPLHLVPYMTAWHMFLGLSVVTISISIWIVCRELQWSILSSATAILLSLASSPALFLFKRNHMEFILLLLAVIGWRALRRGRVGYASGLWGVAAALKLFPAAWLLSFFIREKSARGFTGPAIFLVITVLSAALVGWTNTADFITVIIPQSSQWYGVVGNYSLVSFGATFWNVQTGWTFTSLVVAYCMQQKFWNGSVDSFFIRAMTFALIVSPLSWMNYQILLLPVILILLSDIPKRSSFQRVFLYLSLLVIWGFPGDVAIEARNLRMIIGFLPLYASLFVFLAAEDPQLEESTS